MDTGEGSFDRDDATGDNHNWSAGDRAHRPYCTTRLPIVVIVNGLEAATPELRPPSQTREITLEFSRWDDHARLEESSQQRQPLR